MTNKTATDNGPQIFISRSLLKRDYAYALKQCALPWRLTDPKKQLYWESEVERLQALLKESQDQGDLTQIGG